MPTLIKTRAAVMRQLPVPRPYARTRPLAIEAMMFAPLGADERFDRLADGVSVRQIILMN